VIRVITRFYGIRDDIRSSAIKNQVQEYADELIAEQQPGDFNQAVMELGATVCKPSNPDCGNCPLSVRCLAFNTAQTDVIPYKSPAKKIPHHQIAVGLIVNDQNELLIALRPNDGMLGGLWEFPGGKKEKNESLKKTVARELKEELGVDVDVFKKFQQLNHAYSHFKITCMLFGAKSKPGNQLLNQAKKLCGFRLMTSAIIPFQKRTKP